MEEEGGEEGKVVVQQGGGDVEDQSREGLEADQGNATGGSVLYRQLAELREYSCHHVVHSPPPGTDSFEVGP